MLRRAGELVRVPGAPMSTYRERREARADRLDGWADGRERKAGAEYERASAKADAIPLGQPILVGHHSEGRDRRYREGISRGFERSFEHAKKARKMSSTAAEIRRQADHAVYSDDVDAVERLEARIAELEGERARWKAYNAACRKARRRDLDALELLDDAQRGKLLSVAQHSSFSLGQYGEAPAYVMSNLAGNIRRQKLRLERIRAERGTDDDQ